MENYWTGKWNLDNLHYLAEFQNWQTNTPYNRKDYKEVEKLQDFIIETGNIGDSEIRLVYDNEFYLVFISFDSQAGDFLNIIDKKDTEKSTTIELQ